MRATGTVEANVGTAMKEMRLGKHPPPSKQCNNKIASFRALPEKMNQCDVMTARKMRGGIETKIKE